LALARLALAVERPEGRLDLLGPDQQTSVQGECGHVADAGGTCLLGGL
jgi:hypothetical protein